MINIDKQSRIPIYEQLIDAIKEEVINGDIREDDMIPSVRGLSMDLSVNPNTIQKAYNELERIGITRSVPGVGRYITKKALDLIKDEKRKSEEDLKRIILDLKLAGYSKENIFDKIEKYYGGE